MSLAYLDPQDSLRLRASGVYERWETDLVQRMLCPGQVFVDVGAHIGYYSTLAAGLVGPEGEVHAFEPCAANARLLRLNVAPFGDRVRVYEAAVSDTAGVSWLYICEENSGDHRLYATPGRQAEPVDVVRLDDVRALRGKRIDFLKVDVQGQEQRVINGARRLVADSPDLTGIVEFWPTQMRVMGLDPAAFLADLVGLGLSIYSWTGEGFTPADLAALPDRRRHLNLAISRKGLA